MMDMTDDAAAYLDYVKPQASGVDLEQLSALAEEQRTAEEQIKKAEEALSHAKERLREINEVALPELMDRVGMAEFKTASGLTITIKENIRASIPRDMFPVAVAWLRNHGHGAMIKRSISVSFGRGEDEKADLLAQELSLEGFEATDDTSIHNATLVSFVKEKLNKGENLPDKIFSVFRQRVSKVGNARLEPPANTNATEGDRT